MEMWQGLSYDAAMSIPMSRRRRFMQRKEDLERRRESEHKAAMSRARAKR